MTSVDGVAEVASIGGFVRQYQIEVDPVRLRAYGISIQQVKQAVQRSNGDVGGRLVEMAEREFMVRGRGYVREVRDLEQVVLRVGPGGVPVLLQDVAHVTIGPEIRRGLADWNGEGETVGGIVVVRYGADTRSTIARVQERLAELKAGLPEDVEISVAYDRTGLIERSIDTLTHTLIEESIVVSLVCIVFLFHVRSALVAIFSIPVSILLAFIIMKMQGLGANIMSLGGIAISIGVLIDASIIMVENAHKHYEEWQGKRSHFEIILRSAQEVGPTLFFTLLDHHRLVHAGLHSRGAGGPAVQAPGVHQDLRHGDVRHFGGDRRPGADVLVRPRQNPQRAAPPDLAIPALSLHPGPQPGTALALGDVSWPPSPCSR